MKPVLRTLRATANGARFRTAQFDGRAHIVVPVVLMVGDIVVHPVTSTAGEFVPSEVLAEAPRQWDGRPVVPNHPEGDTANEPRTLEARRFGTLFGSRFEAGRLKSQAWIDVERAKQIGRDAEDVVRRLTAGEVVDVSVGAWVTLEERAGSAGGRPYKFIWRNLASDHLAMLDAQTGGACGIADGCGAPRSLSKATEADMKHKSLWASALEALGLRPTQAQDDVSVEQLFSAIHSALRADEPAFDGIVDVFLDSSTVVYAVSPDGDTELFRRKYSVGEDGEVKLGDKREGVELQREFVPLEAGACGCEGECTCSAPEPAAYVESEPLSDAVQASAQQDMSGAAGETARKEHVSMDEDKDTTQKGATAHRLETMSATSKELVQLIIASARSPFDESDYRTLASFPEERLRSLYEHYTPEPQPVSDDDYIEALPANLRDMFRRMQAEEAERRMALVAAIKAAQDVYTVEQLKRKPTTELEALAKVLRIGQRHDYSGRGLPTSSLVDFVEPPNPYEEGLKRLRERYSH